MIDYDFKSKVMSSDIFKDFKRISKSLYRYYDTLVNGVVYDNSYGMTYQKAGELYNYYEVNFPKEFKECKRIWHAHLSRVSRLKKRVESIVSRGDCVFVTLTFNEKSMQYKESVRKQYVKEYLSSLECAYVANIDYGKKYEREHYHALVAVDRVDFKEWKYGRINGKRVLNHTNDISRISKYIAKLVNHAIKETNKRQVVMYSRKYK